MSQILNILRFRSNEGIIYNIPKQKYLKLNQAEAHLLKQLKHNDPIGILNESNSIDSSNLLEKLNKFDILPNQYFNEVFEETGERENGIMIPLKIFLDLTNQCNGNCIHCFMDSGETLSGELSLSQLVRIVTDMRSLGVMQLSIGGGEPLIRGDALEFLSFAVNKGLSISLTTNGSFIDEQVASQLSKLKLKSITISVDGATNKTFRKIRSNLDLETTKKAIKSLIDSNIETEISIRTSVNSINQKEILDIYSIAENLKVNTFKINNTNSFGRAIELPELFISKEDFMEIISQLKEKSSHSNCRLEIPSEKYFIDEKNKELLGDCRNGIDFINILADGMAAPCAFSFRKINFGNIKTMKLIDIFKVSSTFNKENDICNNCKALSYKNQSVLSNPKHLLEI